MDIEHWSLIILLRHLQSTSNCIEMISHFYRGFSPVKSRDNQIENLKTTDRKSHGVSLVSRYIANEASQCSPA